MAQRLCYFLSNKLSVTLLFDVLPTLLSVLAAHQLVALSCILYSEFLYPTMCVCVCLMPFIPRHGTGCALRSGEVFRSQIPCEKTLFPSVQKQVSGLPCWDRVYVSVSLSCIYVRYDKQHEVHAC